MKTRTRRAAQTQLRGVSLNMRFIGRRASIRSAEGTTSSDSAKLTPSPGGILTVMPPGELPSSISRIYVG